MTAQVVIGMEDKRQFVMDYTALVFEQRLKAVGEKLPSHSQLAEIMRDHLVKAWPKWNAQVETMRWDDKERKFYDDSTAETKLYSSVCNGVDVDGIIGVLDTKPLRRAYRDMWPAARSGGEVMSGVTSILGKTCQLAKEAESRRYYGDKLPFFRVPYPCTAYMSRDVDNRATWPCDLKKNQDPKSGEVYYTVVFSKKLESLIPKKRQELMLKYTESVMVNLSAYNDLLGEAAQFATELYKLIRDVRTVKKLKDSWPEMWPEFRKLTGLDPDMSGKALSTQVDTTLILNEINQFKGKKAWAIK